MGSCDDWLSRVASVDDHNLSSPHAATHTADYRANDANKESDCYDHWESKIEVTLAKFSSDIAVLFGDLILQIPARSVHRVGLWTA